MNPDIDDQVNQARPELERLADAIEFYADLGYIVTDITAAEPTEVGHGEWVTVKLLDHEGSAVQDTYLRRIR